MVSSQESKNLSRERFGKFSNGYVTSQSHVKGYDLDRLVEIAVPQADWLVLDIATGGGHTALKFAPHVRKVIATDITPKMLAAAETFISKQSVSNVFFKLADAENLPFEDGTFNLVTCRIAPHHFPACVCFILEGSRVLKAGGLLLVQDHLLPEDDTAARYIDSFERLRDPSHHRAFSLTEWVNMFYQAGLQVEHTQEIIKRHPFIPWAERQGCTPEIIKHLKLMLIEAPPIANKWLNVVGENTLDASFTNHHILIAGRRSR